MRQRRQHIASAAQGADQPGRAGQRQQQARIEGAQHHRAHHRQERPAQHLHPGGHHRDQHPPSRAQQKHPEHPLDAFHPGAGTGQQRARRRAHQQQRNAHAPGHREQGRAAQDHVPGLRDVQQRARQRRGHARADDQCRQRPHDQGARYTATRDPVGTLAQAGLQARRHLEGEGAEHRQRQDGQQDGEQRQDPRRLQPRRQASAAQAGRHAQRGIDDRHAEHIGGGQPQAAPAAWALRLRAAQHDGREDRHHRQYAGRKRQQHAQQQEHAGRLQPPAAADEVRKPRIAGFQQAVERAAALRRGRRTRRERIATRHGRQLHRIVHRRVAQAGVGAALAGDCQGERLPVALRQRHAHRHGTVKDLHVLIKGRVILHLALWIGRLAQRHRLRRAGRQAETLAVHVVLGRDPVIQDQRSRVGHGGAEHESLLGRQEVVFGQGGCGAGEQHQRQGQHPRQPASRGRGAACCARAVPGGRRVSVLHHSFLSIASRRRCFARVPSPDRTRYRR
ncbi:Uncharacterised protein [Bordetella pertussis]|nr:Uncharacterised protein [Bordetella pertussis]